MELAGREMRKPFLILAARRGFLWKAECIERCPLGLGKGRWKRADALQWHLWEKRRREAHPEAQQRKRLLQVCLQICGRLLEDGNGQGLGRAKAQVRGVITDVAMRSPSPSRHTLDLAMSRQTAVLADKAERGKRGEPGKPLWAFWLKGQQTVLGANHHVVPFAGILDQG